MKIKASELRKSLKEKGLDEADVELLVKSKVDAGEAEDDETSPDDDTNIDVGQLDAFADAFAKSRETPLSGADALNKSNGELGGGGDLLQLLETFAAAQDETLGRLDDNHLILGEGLLAVGETTKGLVKAFGDIRRDQREIKTLMSEVRDRLGEPVAPRAADLGEPDAAAAANLAKSSRSIQRAALAEMKRSDTSRERRQELADAVKRIEKGEDPAAVAKTANINV